jgi:hypothetical protein
MFRHPFLFYVCQVLNHQIIYMKKIVLLLTVTLALYNISYGQQDEGTLKNAAAAYINGAMVVYPYKVDSTEPSFKGFAYDGELEQGKAFEVPIKNLSSVSLAAEGEGYLFTAHQNTKNEGYVLMHLDKKLSNYNLEYLSPANNERGRAESANMEKYMYAGFKVKNYDEESGVVDVLMGDKSYSYNIYARMAGNTVYKGEFCIAGGYKDKAVPGLYVKAWTLPLSPQKNLQYKIVQGGNDTVGVLLYATNHGKSNCRLMIIKASNGKLILDKEIFNPQTPECTFADIIYNNGNYYIAGLYSGLGAQAQAGAQGYYVVMVTPNGTVIEKRQAFVKGDDREVPEGVTGRSMIIHELTAVRNEVRLIGENIAYKGISQMAATYSLSPATGKAPVVSDEAYSYGFTFVRFDASFNLMYSKFTTISSDVTRLEEEKVVPCKCTDMATCAGLVPGVNNGATGIVTGMYGQQVVYKLGSRYYNLAYNTEDFVYSQITELDKVSETGQVSLILGTEVWYYALSTSKNKNGAYTLLKLPFK